MDFELNDEQRLIRETARSFTDNEIIPRARDNDRNHRFDLELVGRIAEQGYLGAIVPAEYGGAGLDYLTYGVIVEQIGRGDSSMRTVVSVQTSLVCSAIVRWGTEEQKLRYLPRLCSGEWLGCFGLTEPDTGSDAANQRTRATRTDSGWVINGAKMWISMGNHAKLAMIFAQTDPEKAHKGLACFLVETEGNEGYQPQEIHGKMGLHGSDTAAISLSDCEVPEDAMLGEIGDGFRIAMTSLESGRYSVASGCVGICQGCLDYSVQYAKERRQFGRPIAAFQLVQGMLADMKVQTDAARMLVYRAGYLKDSGQPNSTETSVAKLYATEAAVQCANTAIQVLGGSGYVDDHPVERYFRDVRVTTLYEGTSQIQKLIIGRALTGINALVPS
jgi:butyryl-CoA dehydrogenase